MWKTLQRFILHYKWKKLSPDLIDERIPVLKRALIATKLFCDVNKPEVSLKSCREYYLKPPTHSLHTMLSELSRAREEFQKTGSITPAIDVGMPELIRVDKWCSAKELDAYRGIDIYQGYQIACGLVKELHGLIKTDNHVSYIERRCKKALITFILLTELLGFIKYDEKK